MTRHGVLTYRSLEPSDVEALHQMVSHWSVVRQLGGWPWPPDRAFTEGRSKPYDGDGFVWGVFEDGALVGTLGVTRYRQWADIGYMFAPEVAGRGIATTAAGDAVDHAFATRDLPEIQGSTWHDNPASGRVLTKLGFRHWSTRYDRSKARGVPTLIHSYRLSRATWEAASHAPPRLNSKRLVLRPAVATDADWIAKAANDLSVSKWLTRVCHPYDRSDAVEFLAAIRAGELGLLWVIEEGAEPCGVVSIDTELGYWLRPECWGRGIMTEAARMAVDHAFTDPALAEIPSSHFVGNEPSRTILTKLGFEDTGPCQHHCLARGTEVDGRTMRLTRERWRRLSADAQ